MASGHKIRIKLRAYDHRLLDLATAGIVDAAKRTGAGVRTLVRLLEDAVADRG